MGISGRFGPLNDRHQFNKKKIVTVNLIIYSGESLDYRGEEKRAVSMSHGWKGGWLAGW